MRVLNEIELKTNNLCRLSPDAAKVLTDNFFLELKNQSRHFTSNTFDHSVRVASISAKLADKWNVPVEEIIVAALLHDYCDRPDRLWKLEHLNKVSRFFCKVYMFWHPEEALRNAREQFKLTAAQENAILAHMFPFAIHLPRTKMALIILLADKLATPEDFVRGMILRRQAANATT